MDESRDAPTRRRFLSRAAVGLAGVTATGGVAGCLGDGGPAGGDGTDGSGDGDSGAEAATPTPTPAGLRLETLDVEGSPGGQVAVKPHGEAALLDFFATWCAPCKPQMAELRTVQSEHPDLHILSMSQEEDAGLIREFWVEYEGTWPVAQDTRLEAFQEYDVTRIPTMVLLDADGEEVWRHSGLSPAGDIIERIEEAGG
ncbi:MAG: TlpA family protein disulfide reductase [Halobacteriales archaeon SW_9_67_25]|nr:MAG: TlpA family protein disulfide reductase [Halobacteriales archaeon SW_9_67_25]